MTLWGASTTHTHTLTHARPRATNLLCLCSVRSVLSIEAMALGGTPPPAPAAPTVPQAPALPFDPYRSSVTRFAPVATSSGVAGVGTQAVGSEPHAASASASASASSGPAGGAGAGAGAGGTSVAVRQAAAAAAREGKTAVQMEVGDTRLTTAPAPRCYVLTTVTCMARHHHHYHRWSAFNRSEMHLRPLLHTIAIPCSLSSVTWLCLLRL